MNPKPLRRFFLAAIFAAAVSWSAPVPQPSADSGSIAGKWHFLYNTEGGDRDSDADFKLEGDQVTGKYNKTADVKGTFKNGDLDLAFPYNSEEAGMTATLKMKGKLKDGKIVGNWEFADYMGTFTATREK